METEKQISSLFYIYHKKFEVYTNKSIDYYIKSWKFEGVDREILEKYQEKYEKLALKYLELANEELKKYFYD